MNDALVARTIQDLEGDPENTLTRTSSLELLRELQRRREADKKVLHLCRAGSPVTICYSRRLFVEAAAVRALLAPEPPAETEEGEL